MTDDDFLLLNAYHDGELSPTEALEMERRLAADPALRATADRLGTLSGALREALAVPPPSSALRTRVVQQIGFSEPPVRWWRQHRQALAATLLIGLIGGGVIGSGATYLTTTRVDETAMDAIVGGHLRALTAAEPYDIASSNRHVVKPWFNGRTTIAPQTPDLADKGFALVGGRIDVVSGKTVPTLVYRHDQHVISVTILPEGQAVPAAAQRDGYTVRSWHAGGLTYVAVSDVDEAALINFERLFRASFQPE